MESAIWGLIGTIVGAAASLCATYLTNAHAEKQSTESRRQDRLDKFKAFQRETILELQLALHDVARTTFLIRLEDSEHYLASGDWGKRNITEPLAEDDRDARSRIALYVERVADEEVRREVGRLLEDIHSVILAPSKSEANIAHAKVSETRKRVVAMVGKALRETY